MRLFSLVFATVVSTVLASSAIGQTTIQVDFNPNADTPVGFSALAAVFHDGSFDSFSPGQDLSGSVLEVLAETGNNTPFLDAVPAGFNSGTNGSALGPGLGASFEIDVDDANSSFSFASMVLFSSDWFIGNNNSNLIDVSSLVNGSIGDSLEIDLTTVYDADTETEDYTGVGGSGFFPFSTSGALGQDIDGGSAFIVDRSTNPFLNFTNNENLDLNGFDPASLDAFTNASLGNITLTVVGVPEPTSCLAGFVGLALFARRRRRS